MKGHCQKWSFSSIPMKKAGSTHTHWNCRITLVHRFNSSRDFKVVKVEILWMHLFLTASSSGCKACMGQHPGSQHTDQEHIQIPRPSELNLPSLFSVWGLSQAQKSKRNISETWKGQPCPWEIENNCTKHPVTKSRSLMSSASIWEPLKGEERGSCSSEEKNLGLCGLGKFYMWVKMLSLTLWSLFFQKIMSCLFENYCKFWNYFLLVHWLRNNLACW